MRFLNIHRLSRILYKVALLILLLALIFAVSGCAQKDIQTGAGVDTQPDTQEDIQPGKEQEAEQSGTDDEAVDDEAEQKKSVDYIYGIPMDENAGVIVSSTADLYVSPDVKSSRITQAIFNQPISIISDENGWAQVKTVDGNLGWMKSKNFDDDVSSVYGRMFTHRVIVTSREKSVYSYPSGGITLMVAPMGSEFYAINNIGDSYEVYLPGKRTGWLRGSGIIHVSLDEMIPVTNAEDFASTALRLKGASYLLSGMSASGIDAPGLVYVCARINGVNLPRTIKGQLATGMEIKTEDASIGDLVFLAGTGDKADEIVSVGICTGGSNYIYAGRKAGYVTIGDINRENKEGIVVSARRIFN